MFLNPKIKITMKIKTLFIINAVITAVFGIAFVIMPEQLLLLYGDSNAGMEYTGQLFGSALIVFAILSWLVKDSQNNETLKAITLSLFIGNAIGFVVALVGQLEGVVNELGWSTVAIYFLLSLGFGYFRFKK